jgi:AraC-like DNA-binding protein
MSKTIQPLEISRKVVISSFNTIDYYNLNKDFYQIPDSHPYWEMVYVDRGTVISDYNGIGHTLSEGEVIFHPPHSMHSHISNKVESNSILVVSFSSESDLLEELRQKTFLLTAESKQLLSFFLEECNKLLGGIENTSGGIPKELIPVDSFSGSTQILECYFIEFIYSVIRSSSFSVLEKTGKSSVIASNSFVELIKSYLFDNMYKAITLDSLCKKFNVSKSNLCKKWREHSDIGIIDYFIALKVNEAKKLLQEGNVSITQISDTLGYSTIHHFSHSFKKCIGMSPSEYKKSLSPKASKTK